jgi:hypothetical protein
MLIRKTYLDLSPGQRRQAAKAAKARYQGVLSDPGIVLTPEQRADIQARLRHLARWEAGTLPVTDVPQK